MSTWRGFDQRKVCPQCGEYQTRVIRNPSSTPAPARLSVLAALIVGLVILTMIVLLLFVSPIPRERLWMLFVLSLIGLGLSLFHPRTKRILGEDRSSRGHSQTSQEISYLLTCRHCGHQWELSNEDWETAGQRERENLINFPSLSPSRGTDPAEGFEKIEWKPPNPSRGILILIGTVTVFMIASVALFGIFWSLTHPDHSYAPVVSSIGLFVALLIYVGLARVFKSGAAKTFPIVLVILIALAGIALRFLLK